MNADQHRDIYIIFAAAIVFVLIATVFALWWRAMTGKNRIMIYGPKNTAPTSSNSRRRGRGAAISVPAGETAC